MGFCRKTPTPPGSPPTWSSGFVVGVWRFEAGVYGLGFNAYSPNTFENTIATRFTAHLRVEGLDAMMHRGTWLTRKRTPP